ncbi:MAG TPA: S8 family serine peptidase [Steroidobacteraceae bacterium]|nr:S8 family serine peptidase [Steroidobacteraceae bacterium]
MTTLRHWQRIRFISSGMLAAAVVAMIPLCATAQSNGRHALTRLSGVRITGAPLAQRPQIVMLKLAGDSVAVVRSRMPGKQLAEADRQSIERDLRHKQNALVPSIEAIGGTVLGQFQHAINGIKVSATPDQIKSFASLPGVVAVKHVRSYHLDNAESVPFIGAPQAWQGPPGVHGEHIRVAVIDTGVDYTHANFGGPGTVAAWTTAFANNTKAPDPAMFGPNAPKVKGGIDLVGDAYDGVANNVPVPDPNPLDCNGHGSHTSGTATGFGVATGGTTFKGPYDAATPGQSFIIGPGVAPLADLYAVRVFGCKGSTNVVIDGIDWAVAHNMQVISMSLGADWGTEDDADAEASENAVNAGIVVAAASGNEGPAPYITSSPGSGDKVISVAAIDSHSSFPGETLTLTPSGSITALDANGIPVGNGTSLQVVVLKDTKGTGSGGISLGCDPAEYTAAGVAGKLVVTVRGNCARVDRAIYGQQAGAAAVAMINNAAGYPPYEGPITSNPDTGAPYTVTIPFLGVQGPPSTDGPTLAASTAASFATTTIVNPTFRRFASFSSAGPRTADGHLKPDISAPGVSIFSTAMGTGNQGLFESGTSMATPHVAGSAALAIQAHPHWEAEEVSAAVVNTADATKIAGYSARLGGNGLVQPFAATRTSVFAQAEDGTPSVSFGVSELTHDFSDESRIIVQNRDGAPASFSISVVQGSGAAHTATVSPTSITLSAHERRTVQVHLTVPVATVGDSSAFRQVQGRVVFTPTSGNNQVTLSVPYYLVPRARSMVDARLSESDHASTVRLDNESKSVAGTADFYAWGLRGSNASLGSIGLRAVGVQSFADPGNGQMLVFAVNTFGRSSNPATTVYDVLVDVNGDGAPDYDIEAVDLGLLTTGSPNGELVVAVFDLNLGGGVLEFFATAPTDGTTVLLPLVAADIGITAANPRFSYVALTTDLLSAKTDMSTSAASFNAFNSSISTGAYVSLAPGMKASVPLTIDRTEFRKTPALGQMVVTLENKTKENDQALLLRLGDD